MIKKHLFCLIATLTICNLAFGQGWVKVYDDDLPYDPHVNFNYNDYLYSNVIPQADGSFVWAFPARRLVLKTDSSGTKVWNQVFSSYDRAGSSLKQFNDSTLVYFISDPNPNSISLGFTSTDGDSNWTKSFNYQGLGAISMDIASDGGLIVSGTRSLMRLNPNLDTLWIKRNTWDVDYTVINRTLDDGYIWYIRHIDISLGGLDYIRMYKLDYNGDTVWTTYFQDHAISSDIVIGQDTNYYFFGAGNPYIVELSKDGDYASWWQFLNRSGYPQVKQSADNRFIVLSKSSIAPEFWLEKLSPSMGLEWSQSMDIFSGQPLALDLTNDGGYIMSIGSEKKYYLIRTDSLGNTPFTVDISGVAESCLGTSDGTVWVNAIFGGNAPYTYQWSNGSTAAFGEFVTGLSPGTISVTVTDSTGNTASDNFMVGSFSSADCVWPGDANSDGIANNLDVLAIGIGYGISGPARPNATLNWEGQDAPDWPLALANGVNLKHTDCNGDSVIDHWDTTAITLNYGLTHPKNSRSSTTDPEIFILIPDQDTIPAGSLVELPVVIGADSLQVNNFYGVGFSIEYSTLIVEDNVMLFKLDSSFLGTPGINVLSYFNNLDTLNQIDIAVTRTDQMNVSGYGRIGTLEFTTEEDIVPKNSIVRELNFNFTHVYAIDNQENQVPLSSRPASLYVIQETVGTQDIINESGISIIPNPGNGVAYIVVEGLKGKPWIKVFDVHGKTIIDKDLDSGSLEHGAVLDLQRYNGNIFMISIQNGEKVYTARLLKY